MDLSVFNSLRLEFYITNTHTQGRASGNTKIQLVELMDQAMKLDVPSGFCAKGNYLIIDIDIVDEKNKKSKFHSGVKVEDHVSDSPGVDRIQAALIQFDKAAWEKFTQIFENRQASIDEFFRAAKGY